MIKQRHLTGTGCLFLKLTSYANKSEFTKDIETNHSKSPPSFNATLTNYLHTIVCRLLIESYRIMRSPQVWQGY